MSSWKGGDECKALSEGVAAFLFALYWVAPEKGSAIKSINKANKGILDLFDLYDTPKVRSFGVNDRTSVREYGMMTK